MVKVYFETKNGSYAEQVATFEDESLFNICLPHLGGEARKQGYILTESVDSIEEEKKKTYYLFGKDAIDLFLKEGAKAVLKEIERQDFDLFCFIEEETKSTDFIDAFQNWSEYIIITEEDFKSFTEAEEEQKDLFEYYEEQPEELKDVLKAYENFEELDYQQLEMMQKECEKIGYTFDFYLDAQAHNLRKLIKN
jgi:hypothetical protein